MSDPSNVAAQPDSIQVWDTFVRENLPLSMMTGHKRPLGV